MPSPPVAQFDGSSPFIESKTLIDASDKPLRRLSPPGKAGPEEEDWPVLHPKRSASPGTLQEMMREEGSQLTQQAASSEKERYPLLSKAVRHVPSEEQIPVSRYSVSYKALTKNTSSPTVDDILDENKDQANGKKSIDDPFKDNIYDCGPVFPTKGIPESPSGLSAAAAAAVEKSGQESKPTIEPRQTRTSSLRARLSAGQLVKNGHSKVISFTDFTVPMEYAAGPGRKDSLRARKEAQAGRLTTLPANNTIRSNRAPAQFIGGSRRPTHPRCPSSRGSLRNESRASIPPLIPNRPAPPKPVSKSSNIPSTSPRNSSVLVPRAIIEHATHGREKGALSVSKTAESTPPMTPKKEPRKEKGIYEDPLSADIVSELQATTPPMVNGWLPQISLEHNASRALEDIEESPQHTYQLKRLSSNSPDLRPVLKISPSADWFIMGPGPDKENRSLTKKRSKELDHSMIKDDSKTRKYTTKPVSVPKKGPERPSSSQGLSRLTSRVGLIDPKIREKKTKSADLSHVSTLDRVQQESIKPTSESCRNYPDSSAKASKASTNNSNDPFFDAPEAPLTKPEDRRVSSQALNQREGIIDEAVWISPVKEKKSVSGDDKALVLDEHLSANLQEQLKVDMKTEKKLLLQENPFQAANIGNGVAQQSNGSKDARAKALPSTPEQNVGKQIPSSGSYPPRISSRMAHPDFTNTKIRSSPPTSTEKAPPTPPKDLHKEIHFGRRQNNLGSLRGHGSSQLDLNNLVSKRDSAARNSYKSQASASKGGMLSNFRGLFHKRSTENAPLLSSKKPKSKAKASINANGSPFPPISEVHPVHRPTLTSLNRSNATTPRPSTTATPATQSFASPIPTEMSTTTNLAMQILDEARNERSSPKKERLLELGRVMVDAVTQARDAEKAMEEAKQAARKAEVANALCKKSLGEVENCVKQWRSEVGR